MIKRFFITLSTAAIALIFSGSAMAAKPGQDTTTTPDETFNGNGSPSGPHFNLNIIGMPKSKGKTAEDDTTNGNGRRIFVILDGNTRILLSPGDFEVIDYDGTDGTAMFQLPNPDEDCDGITSYSVYARAVTPGSATMYSCAYDNTGEEWCSIMENVTVELSKSGKPTFDNVSRELLYVYIDTNGEEAGGKVRVPLFDDSGDSYWWQYDNTGLRLAQLRFYPIATDTNPDEYECGVFPN